MGTIVTTEVTMETTTCITCGVIYAMPAYLFDYHRKHGYTHYCPNGHPQCFIEPEIPKLKGKLEAANCKINQLEYQLNGALDNLRRAQKRANAGLCPHCRRHFANLERHIQCKHKDKL